MEGYPSWFEIDLDNIEYNLQEIKGITESQIIPCVKNNAYGHGLVPVVAHLEGLDIEWVLVAKLREALLLRENGIHCGVINMGPLFTLTQHEAVVRSDITQVVYTRGTARTLSEVTEEWGMEAKVYVKVDTGLRRVGVWHDGATDLIEFISGLPGLKIEGIFSTLAQNPETDSVQLARILEVGKEVSDRGIDPGTMSLASSDATLHFPEAHLDAVRPGMLLYGVYPTRADRTSGMDLKQALSFNARLEHVKWVEKGDSVTYWGRFKAPRRMRVGTVHVGFYDGLPRELSNRGRVRTPVGFRSILGSVSLNHIVVDLNGLKPETGNVVEIIGRRGENTLNAIAENTGWMTYSLLNHLNPYTPRVYTAGGKPIALLEP